jgi:hypothetical protein
VGTGQKEEVEIVRNRRVLLFSARKLFGEIIEQTLGQMEGLEIVGHWPVDDQIGQRLECAGVDLVVITEEGLTPEKLSQLTAQLLERFPDLPIFRVTLERNLVQVYSSHLLPARREDLGELIRHLPWKHHELDPE